MNRHFWDSEVPDVRAVLDLAFMRDDLMPEAHDLILALFAPDHAELIAELADDIRWAERLRCEDPGPVLSEFLGDDVHGPGLDQYADRLAAHLEADAIKAARLVASSLGARAAA